MKKTIAFLSLAALGLGIFSCEKNKLDENLPTKFADPAKANLRIVNAYTSNVPAGAPGVGVTRFYAYQGTTKLTGNPLASPSVWPATSAYAAVEPGSNPLFMLLDRRVNNVYAPVAVGDTAFRATLNLTAGASYTAFLVGVAPTQEVLLSEDNITPSAERTYKIRVANLVPDEAKALNIFSRRAGRTIASNVSYKQIGNFIELPVPTESDTLDVFAAAAPTVRLYSLNNFFPGNKRVYTLYTQGRNGFRNEALSVYTNR